MDEVINVIELKDVVKDYGDFKLDKISFAVPEGSVCGFIGQNGAGKTTTINLILDVIKKMRARFFYSDSRSTANPLP